MRKEKAFYLRMFTRDINIRKSFPEAKKGVVNYARLRKAAHWPNNNANPSGLSEKKVYCVERRDMCDP